MSFQHKQVKTCTYKIVNRIVPLPVPHVRENNSQGPVDVYDDLEVGSKVAFGPKNVWNQIAFHSIC